MSSLALGLVAVNTMLIDWAERVAAIGTHPRLVVLHTDPPAVAIDLWIVVLRENDPPATVRMWLRQLESPVVVVTPHLDAARRALNAQKQLRLIVHPTRALYALGDVIDLAQQVRGTTLMLGVLCGTMTRTTAVRQEDSYVWG